jgi:AbrB family looped-hinge helix DNA binding protein
MQTRVYAKGQIVLPKPFRESLHIRPGDVLEVELEQHALRIRPLTKSVVDLAGSLGGRRKSANIKQARDTSLKEEAEEVAREGKGS